MFGGASKKSDNMRYHVPRELEREAERGCGLVRETERERETLAARISIFRTKGVGGKERELGVEGIGGIGGKESKKGEFGVAAGTPAYEARAGASRLTAIEASEKMAAVATQLGFLCTGLVVEAGDAILPDTATIGWYHIVFHFGNVYGFNMSCIGKDLVGNAAQIHIVDIVDI
ncbi:putative protein arginine N-methyltransferase 3 [Morella rubra]|uniref:Uncharacterized protein n=1 Tax=Morella rubra TaxID=262757 RepID=A0A6A1VQ84_9ROSI|nr:putative protein arginine N-methyltransferase 3 [Morella rubra]